jgi:hypothetical protein
MTTITITLTEKELRAFAVAKNFIDNAYYDNMLIDEEFGNDHYEQTHRHLDILEEKIQRKLAEKEWIDAAVAQWSEERPDLSKTVLRQHAKKVYASI